MIFVNLSFRHKINLVGGWGHVGICCCLFVIVIVDVLFIVIVLPFKKRHTVVTSICNSDCF